MEIATVDLYRYELSLTTPLRLGASTTQHRRGLLVRLETEQGGIGWGDAAPLPGFSAETLSEVVACARDTAPQWAGTEISEPEGGLEDSLSALPMPEESPASLRFATESAVVDLLASVCDTSVASVLGAPRTTVALNALIPSTDDGPAQAAQYREEGYRAVKVKVGQREMAKEADALRAIRNELGERVALRVDANRAWSLDEAVEFAEATRDLQIAYVEEPLADPGQLEDLAQKTDVPIALDETTREVNPKVLRDEMSVAAVVLKPTLLGGIRETRAWSQTAQEHVITPVLSAAYESGIGLRMLVALAAVGPDTPVGLSTYDRLADDVLLPPLRVDGPTIDVKSVVDAPGFVDEDQLEHIDAFSA